MTIDEAIKVLESEQKQWTFTNTDDNNAAVNLGIEALKTVRATRLVPYYTFIGNLPGETED